MTYNVFGGTLNLAQVQLTCVLIPVLVTTRLRLR